jgi:hypothetical protein
LSDQQVTLQVPQHVHELLKQHHAFYEVRTYYTVSQQATRGSIAGTRRIPSGFEIDVCGTKTSPEQKPGADYLQIYGALKKLVDTVLPRADQSLVEVTPFGSTVIIDTRKQFQQLGMVRIQVTHRDLGQPAGEPEERLVKEIKDRLHDLGLRQR